jgi:2,4-dienoyl-CoA reductase-like NADH-dependent reductase (Old Yellow Enzyme family)
MADRPLLFTPAALRGVKLKNRIVISPMCTNSASDGLVDDWHLLHLGKFAQGAAGLTFTEAAAVAKDARTTHSDLGTAHRHTGVPTKWTCPT